MRRTASSRALLTACAAVALLLALAGPAAAHVSVIPGEVPADGYTKLTFRVGHGCEGSPTTSVRVQIPEGVVSVKPQVLDGWEIATTVGPYAEPVTLHGQELTEGVQDVSWTGGRLDDAHMQEFAISAKMPDAAGETLHFPVLQGCEQGEHRWVEIAEEGAAEEPEEPAPAVLLVAAEGVDASRDTPGDDPVVQPAGDDAAGDDQAAADPAAATGGTGLSLAALLLGLTGTVLGGVALRSSRS